MTLKFTKVRVNLSALVADTVADADDLPDDSQDHRRID